MIKVTSVEGFDIYFEAQKEFVSLKKHLVDECGWTLDEYKSLKATKPKWFCARVVAKKGGIELGESYLGCCIYSSHKEFYTTYFDEHFKDMMANAMAEAKDRLPGVIRSMKAKAKSLSKTISAFENEKVSA